MLALRARVAQQRALVIGPINIRRRRRDKTHRMLGYTWAGAIYYVIRWHMMYMIGSYIGLLTAFIFATIVPSRGIPRLLVGDPLTALLVAAFVLGSAVSVHGVLKPRKRCRRPAVRSAKV